jgi:predicted dehydrogenase
VSARGRWTRGGVDRYMEAELRFPDGRTGRITCSLFSAILLRASARVYGSVGRVSVVNPIAPQYFHRVRVVSGAGSRTERVAGPSTYEAQLRAFVSAVRDGTPVPTGPADAIANMRAIERIYAAAGRPG